jgi:hypothetical protein
MMSSIKVNIGFGEMGDLIDTKDLDFSALTDLDLSFTIDWDNLELGEFTGVEPLTVDFNYNLPHYEVEIAYDTTYVDKGGANEQMIVTAKSITLKPDGYETEIKDGKKVYKTGSGSTTIDLSDTMEDVYNDMAGSIKDVLKSIIEDQINAKLQDTSEDLQEAFKGLDSFTTQLSGLNETISDLFANVQSSLTESIEGIKTQLSTSINSMLSGYVNTLNSYITKINSFIDKATSLISNPNSKLQPVLLYTPSNGSTTFVSGSSVIPTTVKVTGSGKQGVTLIATSYTGELLAPAFKKYVAVVNVIDANGNSAQGGDAKCQAAADLANQEAGTNFGTVVDGGQRGFAFTTKADYAGYTYEIAYAALDYSGKMVTRRFFVKVIK